MVQDKLEGVEDGVNGHALDMLHISLYLYEFEEGRRAALYCGMNVIRRSHSPVAEHEVERHRLTELHEPVAVLIIS